MSEAYWKGKNSHFENSTPNYSNHWDRGDYNRGREDMKSEEGQRQSHQDSGRISFDNLPKPELIDTGPYTGPKWIQQVVLFFAIPIIGSMFIPGGLVPLFALMFAIYLGKPIYKLISFIVYMRKNKLTMMDVYRFYRRKPVNRSPDSNRL